MLLCYLVCSLKSSGSVKLFFMLFVQNKAMQDPEIQNILTDPIMRQVPLNPWTGQVSCLKTYYTGLLMMSCSAGANWFPGEPKGGPGAPEEPRSYAEDSEACKCWDSPNEMIKHDEIVPACSSLVLGFVSSRAPLVIYILQQAAAAEEWTCWGVNLFPNWIVSEVDIGLFMFVALSLIIGNVLVSWC